MVAAFVQGYARGETPNPCVRCNGSFRFAELLDFAERIGARRLATGHYVRTVERGGRLLLARGADREKDQSYMMAGLAPDLLARLWFPLGEQTKDVTRSRAREAGPGRSGQSREPGGVLPRGRRLPGVPRAARARPGARADRRTRTGRRSGRTRGSGASRPASAAASASPRARPPTPSGPSRRRTPSWSGRSSRSRGRGSAWTGGALHLPVERAEAKLRYRSPGIECTVEAIGDGFGLTLDRPAYGVALGQAAVLYEDDAVVGAGLISSAE